MNSQILNVNSHLYTVNSHLKFNLTHISCNLTHAITRLPVVVWGRSIRRWKATDEAQPMVTVWSESDLPLDSANLSDSATYG